MKISLRRSHALIVEDGAFSHKQGPKRHKPWPIQKFKEFKTIADITVSQSVSQKVSEIFRNFQRFSEIFRKIQRVSEIFRNFQKFSEIFRKFQKVLEIFRNFQKVSESFRKFQKD